MAYINADVMRGAFLAIEYRDAIADIKSLMETLAQFESIEVMCDAYINDSRDNLTEDYLFIVPPNFIREMVHDVSIGDLIADEMYSALDTDEFADMLANTYKIAIQNAWPRIEDI